MKGILFSFLLVVAAPVPAADAVISAEARKCFDWFASLGFPEVKEAMFAEVWTGD